MILKLSVFILNPSGNTSLSVESLIGLLLGFIISIVHLILLASFSTSIPSLKGSPILVIALISLLGLPIIVNVFSALSLNLISLTIFSSNFSSLNFIKKPKVPFFTSPISILSLKSNFIMLPVRLYFPTTVSSFSFISFASKFSNLKASGISISA